MGMGSETSESKTLKLLTQGNVGLHSTLVGRDGDGERRWHLWAMTRGQGDDALTVRIDGTHAAARLLVELDGSDASFEVACNKMEVSNIVFLHKGGTTDATVSPGSQKWSINVNASGSTISPSGAPHLMLGFDNGWWHLRCPDGGDRRQSDPWPAVLVPAGDARALVFGGDPEGLGSREYSSNPEATTSTTNPGAINGATNPATTAGAALTKPGVVTTASSATTAAVTDPFDNGTDLTSTSGAVDLLTRTTVGLLLTAIATFLVMLW